MFRSRKKKANMHWIALMNLQRKISEYLLYYKMCGLVSQVPSLL